MYGWGLFICRESLFNARPTKILKQFRKSPWCKTLHEHWWGVVLADMQLDRLTESAKICPYNKNYDLGGLRFLSPALQDVAKLHYELVRHTCTVEMYQHVGERLLGKVQELAAPGIMLQFAEVKLASRAASTGDPVRYRSALKEILGFMLPAIVHSYLKEYAADRQEADAARKGRQKDKACHREIVDFMKTAAKAVLPVLPAP